MRSLILLLIAGSLVAADAPPIAYPANAGGTARASKNKFLSVTNYVQNRF